LAMDTMGSMRDLDQIQERDDVSHSSRLMSIALGAIASACVLFAVGVMVGREAGDTRPAQREDPLAQLDRLAQRPETAAPATLTYAERLTGDPAGAAASTAVPTGPAAPAGTRITMAAATAQLMGGPSLGDASQRPVLLPQSASPLGGFGVRLNESALTHAGSVGPSATAPRGTPVPAGSDGPYTVQVSSFRAVGHANTFAQRLRDRGHHAYVAQPATDPNNVVWHRVRVGPFNNLREAGAYRADFENRERMPAIVVRREAPAARP
jgi:cell division septation protein DedD